MNILGFHFGRSAAPVGSGLSQSQRVAIVRSAAMDLLQKEGFELDASGGIRSATMREIKSANASMFRAYEGAITDSYNVGFRSTYGSSDAEIMSSLYQVRGRARTIAKDTPHGKNIVRNVENNVVGHRGFRLKMRLGKKAKSGNKDKFTPETDLNEEIERLYKLAGKPENFTVRRNMSRMAAFRIMEASAFRDGFIMLRHHRGFIYNDFSYAVELLEGDRLQDSYMGRADITGNPIRFSIELHPIYKFPVAFWILSRHPGDPFGSYPSESSNVWRERIDADEIILYNNLADRAEQTIGFPELDSGIQHMFRDAQYEKAMTLAAIASCCKPFWIEKLFPTGMNFDAELFNDFVTNASARVAAQMGETDAGLGSGAAARQQGIGARTSTEVPAGTKVMEWGEKLQQIDPKFPIEAASGFKRDNLHAVAASVGQSYQQVSGDFQNLGFSASRASQLPQQDNYKVRQEHFKDMVVIPEFRERIRAAIMAGMLKAPMSRLDEIVECAHFQGVRWPFVNPLQDVQATILQLEAGLVSRQQVQNELEDGVSIEDLYRMIEEDKECQEEHGLDLDSEDVTKPTVKQGLPGEVLPAPSDAAQPASATKLANPVRRRGMSTLTANLLAMQGDGGASLNGARH